MRVSKKTLVVLGIVAVACAVLVVVILWHGLQGDVAQDAANIWRNTQRSGQDLADGLAGR